MSACISSHGEYSAHEPDDEFVCRLCGELDERSLRAELARLRSTLPARTEAEVRRKAAEKAWDEGAQSGLDAGLTIAENVHANGGALDLASIPGAPHNPY